MPDVKRKQSQENQMKQEASSQRDASQRSEARQSVDHRQAITQLREALAEKQKDLANHHASENRSLDQSHRVKHEELASVHATDSVRATKEQAEDRSAEVNSLERYQAAQREQVTERQALEQRVLNNQVEAVSSLETRQRDQMDAIAKLQAWMEETGRLTAETQKELTSSRQRLEANYQAEREKLQATFRMQDQVLSEHRDTLERQMKRDQQKFQETLYGGQQGIEHRNMLQEALARQEAARQELSRAIQAELGMQQRQQQERQMQEVVSPAAENAVLDQKFSRHQVIKDLWLEAVAAISARKAPDLNSEKGARNAYHRTMRAFITRLTRENDTRAEAARKIFEDAGFKFLQDEGGRLKRNLPILALSKAEEELVDMSKHADLLRISGQHLKKVSQESLEALNPDNLVFMIARDNMYMDLTGEEHRKAEEVRKRVV